MDNSKGVDLIDTENALRIVDEETALIRRVQDVDDRLLSQLNDKRLASQHAKMGDLHHVCSIPTVIVEKWMAEGFNIFDKNVSLPDVVKRLHSEDMSLLMATSKRVF